MLVYPEIDPIALELGPLKVRWYGLMYLFGLVAAWALVQQRAARYGWNKDQVSDLMFYGFLGVVLGGRLGYMLFYDLGNWLDDPLRLFAINQGGMSFHGGLLGVLIALAIYCRVIGKGFWPTVDYIAPVVPLGLASGRLGNFINGELWGRVSDVPWAMVFPTGGSLARHPSQLYQAALEGLALFLILWIYSSKPRPSMAVSGLFLIGYGAFRFLVEFFRQPDAHIGFVALGWATMGQLLTIPMILIGAWMMYAAYHRPSTG